MKGVEKLLFVVMFVLGIIAMVAGEWLGVNGYYKHQSVPAAFAGAGLFILGVSLVVNGLNGLIFAL